MRIHCFTCLFCVMALAISSVCPVTATAAAAFVPNQCRRATARTCKRHIRPKNVNHHLRVGLRSFSFLSSTTILKSAQNEGPLLDTSDTSTMMTMVNRRRAALDHSLEQMHMDPVTISEANSKNLLQPTSGYDPSLGKAAIRCYRSFLTSTKYDMIFHQDPMRLVAAADRCARQIDHLRRRHLAQHMEWVRNHDNPKTMSPTTQTTLAAQRRFPMVLVLDNIRSAFNVGSLFRTAEACSIAELITVRSSRYIY